MSENIRTQQGRVISDKGDKTIVVAIERFVKHPIYGKYIKRTSKLHVHDESNQCNQGDTVEVRECRPISKRKSWTLVRVVEKITHLSDFSDNNKSNGSQSGGPFIFLSTHLVKIVLLFAALVKKAARPEMGLDVITAEH